MVQKPISILMSIIVTFFCALALLEFTTILNQKININQTSRRYLLKMETTGYLTDSERLSLISELNRLGVTNVSLIGTSFQDVGYGNDVILEFTGKLHYKEVKLLSLFEAEEVKGTESIRQRIVSTAKN